MARNYRNLGNAIKFTARTVDKTATGLGRWAATDHTGKANSPEVIAAKQKYQL